jgi:hypothetical protein
MNTMLACLEQSVWVAPQQQPVRCVLGGRLKAGNLSTSQNRQFLPVGRDW